MGFHAYSSPYDWSRIAGFKATAKTVPGGMIDLSVGSPVDPVPSSVQQALVAGADAPNAHGYPVTAGTADLKAAHDAVANIDDGVVGIREIVQHDFAVLTEYLLQEIDHRQKAAYGLVHGQLLWVLSKCS